MADSIPVWSGFTLTNHGINQRQRALVEGLRLRFTKAEIGLAVPANPDDIWTMTTLVSPAKQVAIKKSYLLEATHHMIVLIDNKEYTQELFARELGVYAQLEDWNGNLVDGETLYGYAYTIHGYEPIPAGVVFRRTWEISVDTGISRTSDVQIRFDENMVYITPNDLDARVEPLEPYHTLARIDHGLEAYPTVTVGSLQYGFGMGGAGEGPAGGTNMETWPAKVLYNNKSSLTVKTVRQVARPGREKTLVKLDTDGYLVTFDGGLDSVYIQLESSQGGSSASNGVALRNMVIGDTPPKDPTALWGDIT